MLKEGVTYTCRKVVGVGDLASAMGSGDMDVLATPAMVVLMEQAAMLAVAQQLPEGSTTVGTRLEVSHIRATPAGAEVSATATLTAIDGRRLRFAVQAFDLDGIVGEGIHERVIVDRERFLARKPK